MSIATRRVSAWLLIGLGAIWVAWLGGHVQSMGDYPGEFAPSMNALLGGHLRAFVHNLPFDGAGGSLLLRAPPALLGKLLVGSQRAIFRFSTLACVLAAGGLGMTLARDMRRRGLSPAARAATIGLCVLISALLDVVFFGHPEETLGAVLCVAAVLLAGADRPAWAGLALGFAIIDKPWGVLAVAPVLLASPAGLMGPTAPVRPAGLVRLGAVAAGVVLPWVALTFGLDPTRFTQSLAGASSGVLVAHPPDLWWPFAQAVREPHTTPYYTPPTLLVNHARQLAVLIAIPLSLPLASRRLRERLGLRERLAGDSGKGLAGSSESTRSATDSALALLALLFLVRCALDPSDHVYYSVPFVLALLAWDSRVSKAPVRALLAAGLLWLIFHTVAGVASLSVQYAAFMGVALSFGIVLFGPATGGVVRRPRIISLLANAALRV